MIIYKMGFIILHYMELEVTKECVKSIQKNIGEDSYKIVVVDNNSPNKTGELLKDFYKENKNVSIIINDKNDGFARGNNIGYSKLRNECEYICILNNDVELLQNNFYTRVKHIYQSRSFGILGPQIRMLDDTVCDLMPSLGSYEEEKKKYYKKKFRYILATLGLNSIRERAATWKNRMQANSDYNENYTQKRQSNIVLHGCCLIYSKDYLRQNDYAFDPRTDFYGEEALLYLHVRKQKLETLYAPELIILHKESISTKAAKSNYKKVLFQLGNTVRSQKILLKELKENR